MSHSEGVNTDVLPSGRPAPPKPPPARRTRRSCDRESSSSGVPEEDAQALLDMLYDREGCPMGHPLVRFGTDQPGWSCSGCKVSFSQKKLMWGCRTCDVDLCSECLLKSKHDPVAHGSKREPWPIHDFRWCMPQLQMRKAGSSLAASRQGCFGTDAPGLFVSSVRVTHLLEGGVPSSCCIRMALICLLKPFVWSQKLPSRARIRGDL